MDEHEGQNEGSKEEEIAEAFDRSTDPLAELEGTFEQIDADPFELYLEKDRKPKNNSRSTFRHYVCTIEQWKEYMESEGRHPACPNVDHVTGFVDWQREEHENGPKTINNKIGVLKRVFKFWQDEAWSPHSSDFNPIATGQKRVDLTPSEDKKPHPIPIEELRSIISDITHIRDRAIITTQLKHGIRATELCNIKLEDVHIANSELQEHYSELGTHPVLEDRPNAIYIPHDRKNNKSKRPRVLPIDDELRRVLLKYLLIRPDNGEPWLFLSKTKHNQMERSNVNNPWKDYFHPEYAETEKHDSVTSHFGRHYLTTYLKVKQGVQEELVNYIRGDKDGTGGPGDSIDHYIHTYYEDIEPIYRERIFKLHI